MIRHDSTLIKVALSVDRLVTILALLASISSLLIMFVSLMLEVIVRYVVGGSLGWTTETPSLLFPWLVMGGVVVAAQHGQHIAVKTILPLLSKVAARILFISLELLALIFFAYVTYIGMDVIEVVGSEVYPVTGVSAKWAYLALIAGFSGVAITALSSAVQLFVVDDPFSFRASIAEAEL